MNRNEYKPTSHRERVFVLAVSVIVSLALFEGVANLGDRNESAILAQHAQPVHVAAAPIRSAQR